MKKKLIVAALLLGASFAASATLPDGVLARVNGKEIPGSVLTFLMSQAPAGYLKDAKHTEEVKLHVKEQLIRAAILVEEARKEGLDKHHDVQMAQKLAQQDVLVRGFIKQYMDTHKPTEAQIKAAYEKMKLTMSGKELHLWHILVGSEKEAKMIELKLKKGGKFADLAKQYSKDAVSKKQGGDLGWNAPNVYVPAFAKAAALLKKGEVSAPVKTQFGWHIIKLEDSRPLKSPELSAVKPQIIQMLSQQGLQKHIEELRKQAKVEE